MPTVIGDARRLAPCSLWMSWLILALLIPSLGRGAEATWDYAVQVSASISVSPPRITLSWPQDTSRTPSQYIISRKYKHDNAWGGGISLPGNSTSYVDNDVIYGAAYEYQIRKITGDYNGYGYIYAGIDLPPIEHRGKIILVVEQTYAGNLASEINTLTLDLIGDGWDVIRLDVGRNDNVRDVRSRIQSVYNSDPNDVQAVFLLGHVPVPYSGNIFPDNHIEHRGAWPADGYYGEMNGTWTDSTVNSTGATDPRNRNVPGDGKFDQSSLSWPVELQVGRVDLAKLPGRKVWNGPATFPSEVELLRRYLNKNHRYRHKHFDLPRRGIIWDGFGIYGGEATASSGWRNYAPFYGSQNTTLVTTRGQWLPIVTGNGYQWGTACDSGTWDAINGIGNQGAYYAATTTDIVERDPQVAFVMLNGSWFADWDSDDNLMRAFLATPSYGLATIWAGTPHWYVHHMGLGETIGYGTRITQNNPTNGLYRAHQQNAATRVHIALMGDPTLRLHPVAPPTNFDGAGTTSGVTLSWTPSWDNVVGYYVYRSWNPLGPYSRISSTVVNGNSFVDTSPATGLNYYMVRALKRETSGSGSYYNLSQGVFASVDANTAPPPTITVIATDPDAARIGPDPGAVTFVRQGNTANAVTLALQLGGTAIKYTDYRRLEGDMPEQITIPAGASSVTMTLVPQPSGTLTGTKTAVISLRTDPNYLIGNPATASVNITGNALPAKIRRNSSGIILSWDARGGRYYRIAYKDDLNSPTWKDMGVEIFAAEPKISWSDAVQTRRFYLVFESR